MKTILSYAGRMLYFLMGWRLERLPPLRFQQARDHRLSPHVQHGCRQGLHGLSDHQANGPHHDQERSVCLAPVHSSPCPGRYTAQGAVEQMVDVFNSRDEFLLAIVPEGTRKKIRTIKTGFWHIARGAGVSIICWYMDDEHKTARWLGEIIPGEDKAADLIRIRDLYEKAGYRFPLEAADPQR